MAARPRVPRPALLASGKSRQPLPERAHARPQLVRAADREIAAESRRARSPSSRGSPPASAGACRRGPRRPRREWQGCAGRPRRPEARAGLRPPIPTGTLAREWVTCATASYPSGGGSAACSASPCATSGRGRNVRRSSRRWSYAATYQRPRWTTSPYGLSSRSDSSPANVRYAGTERAGGVGSRRPAGARGRRRRRRRPSSA